MIPDMTPKPETNPLDYYAHLRQKIGYSHALAYLSVLAWVAPTGRDYWRRVERWAMYRRKHGLSTKARGAK